MGLLSPSCSLSASYRSTLAASLPRIARAVSPGSACVATKTTTDTRNSVSTPEADPDEDQLQKRGHELPSSSLRFY